MKVEETTVDRFLGNRSTSFAIPVYQRNYDWENAQCTQLFKDILEVGGNDELSGHFIGSIVYMHDDVYTVSSLRELTIIDGQQRLTTLTLIYIVIYRHLLSVGEEFNAEKVLEEYLINKYADEEEKLKLKPTENNREALLQIMDPLELNKVSGYSRLVENFRFFQNKIDASNIETVQKGLSKLIFVGISLDRTRDDSQRIFESLNSTGLELSQADLIRNYILMRLERKEQEQVFRDYWEPIEKNARDREVNKSRVSDFIRDYLTHVQKAIPNKGAVYSKFKDRFPAPNSPDLTAALAEMLELSFVYERLLNPSLETDALISDELSYIRRLETNVSYPFLMPVYRDYQNGVISRDDFVAVLRLVQSFVWRRAIIGLPTNALSKIFMGLYDRIEREEYLTSVQCLLLERRGTSRFPLDKEVERVLKEKDIYSMKSRVLRGYFFARLENHNNRETVDVNVPEITVEHIFPQKPDPEWREHLGEEEYTTIMEQYVNTVGNLTLSGNNGQLGNKAFIEKKDMNYKDGEQGYRYSRLWLNRDLQDLEHWNVEQIKARANRIAQRFLEVWPAPDVEMPTGPDISEVNIFEAEEPTGKKLEYFVFWGETSRVREVTRLYTHVIGRLVSAYPDAFHDTALGKYIQLTSDPASLRQGGEVSESYFVETSIASTTKFERLKFLLTELDLEEELFIKYE